MGGPSSITPAATMLAGTGTTGATGPRINPMCPNGNCQCEGLGFKLCECCLAPEVLALKMMSSQEYIGKANEHVMTAFEKLRMLKVKLVHAKNHCQLFGEKMKSLSERSHRLSQDVEDASKMVGKALKVHDLPQIQENSAIK